MEGRRMTRSEKKERRMKRRTDCVLNVTNNLSPTSYMWDQKVLSNTMYRFTARNKGREFISKFILALNQSVCQLVVTSYSIVVKIL